MGPRRRRRRGPGATRRRRGRCSRWACPAAPALVAVDDLALEQERAAEEAAPPSSPRRPPRGRGSGSRRRSPPPPRRAARRGSRTRSRARGTRACPRAPLPKRKFSPTDTLLGARAGRSGPPRRTPPRCATANSRSNGITTSSSTPRPAIRSRLIGERHDQLRRAPPGGSPTSGCGSKVSTVSLPRITSRWPTWTPSKVPMATRARPRVGRPASREAGDLHAREHYDGLQVRRPRGSAIASSSPPCVRRTGPVRRARRPRAPAPRGRPAPPRPRSSARSGRNASASATGTTPLGVGVLEPEGPDRRALELLAVGVAEVGHELAHVGARRALDLERRRARPRARAARRGGP